MTPQELAIKIRSQSLALRNQNLPLKIAATSAHTLMVKRIFVDGQTANGGGIGSYSTEPIYIKAFEDPIGNFGKKKKPYGIEPRNKKGLYPKTGKNGETGFKTTDRARITSYFEGWKGFREVQGLKTGKVNLNYTGDLFMDFANATNPNITGSETFTPLYVSINEYVAAFRNDLNTKKASGNEQHFGVIIFKLTQAEKAAFYKTANFELKKLLQS